MKLADVRRFAIRKVTKVRFAIPGGLECLINEHGIAQVPGLTSKPDFNLDEALQQATEFTLDPVTVDRKKSTSPQRVTAAQLATMAAAGGSDQPHPDDHDE